MQRERFPLSSDQLELLLAFERVNGLSDLAKLLAKDPSVISRNIQRLSEDAPVLEKVKGRWQITELGRKLNLASSSYLSTIDGLIKEKPALSVADRNRTLLSNAALLLVNTQRCLQQQEHLAPALLPSQAHIEQILQHWRKRGLPIVHLPHHSTNPESMFYKDSAGAGFMERLRPEADEQVMPKSKPNAVFDTDLNATLLARNIQTVVLVGYTANECIDATARQALQFAFHTFVTEDATGSFDFFGHDGRLYKADRIHQLILANLHATGAHILSAKDLIAFA